MTVLNLGIIIKMESELYVKVVDYPPGVVANEIFGSHFVPHRRIYIHN